MTGRQFSLLCSSRVAALEKKLLFIGLSASIIGVSAFFFWYIYVNKNSDRSLLFTGFSHVFSAPFKICLVDYFLFSLMFPFFSFLCTNKVHFVHAKQVVLMEPRQIFTVIFPKKYDINCCNPCVPPLCFSPTFFPQRSKSSLNCHAFSVFPFSLLLANHKDFCV